MVAAEVVCTSMAPYIYQVNSIPFKNRLGANNNSMAPLNQMNNLNQMNQMPLNQMQMPMNQCK